MIDGQQIAFAIAPSVLPTLTVLVGILVNNRQIDSLRGEFGGLRSEMHQGFAATNREFELTRELFTEKLLRLECVMDARLKHLEEQK